MDAESDSFIGLHDWPADWQVEQVDAPPAEPLANVRGEIEAQLTDPLASLPLVDLCGSTTNVVIVCDDVPRMGTRFIVLSGVLSHLERADVDPDRVTLLIAAHTQVDDEAFTQTDTTNDLPWLNLRGYGSRIHIVQHDPNDARELDSLGNFEDVPLTVNYRAAGADLLIAISVIRLEGDALDAGSAATVSLGLVGSATSRELRTTRFYDDQVEPSDYSRPLFQRVVQEIARRAGLVFAVDVIEDARGCALAIRAGSPNAVNDALTELATTMREANVSSSAYDIVVTETGVGQRGGLFDASRAAINLGLSKMPVLMRGGSLILTVNEREDNSPSARAFYDAMTNASSPDLVIRQLQGRSLGHGEARAYLLAHVMQRHHLIATGSQKEQLARDSHFLSTPNLREAAELSENFVGKHPHTLIVRNALRTTPAPMFSGSFGSSDPLDIDDLLAGDPFGIELLRLN